MKNTLFKLLILVMLMTLAACGTFKIDGQLQPGNSQTSTTTQSESTIEGPTQPATLPATAVTSTSSQGLSEFMVVLALLVFVSLVAAVVIGIYMLVRNKSAASAYPTIGDEETGSKGVLHLLRFKPTALSTLFSLFIWAGIIGIGTIITIGFLLLGLNIFPREPWAHTLTQLSSVLISKNDQYIKLLPETSSCYFVESSDTQQELACELTVEGKPLAITVELENKAFWYCDARYENKLVPCSASFDALDYQTYVILESDLGLSPTRFQQLMEETRDISWSEQDWIWLSRVVVFLLSLMLLGLLWRASHREALSPGGIILRIIYSGGISVMFFGAVNYIAFGLLLVLYLID